MEESRLMGESLVSKEFIDNLDIAPQKRLYPDVSGDENWRQVHLRPWSLTVSRHLEGDRRHPQAAQESSHRRRRHPPPYLHHRPGDGHVHGHHRQLRQHDFRAECPHGGHPALPLGRNQDGPLGHHKTADLFCRRHHTGNARHAALLLFAIKPKTGRIPFHRTDVGPIILADLIGSRTIIFIEDEDALFTADPKKHPYAEFIPEIGARDLMEQDMDDLVTERPCLEIIQKSEVIDRVQIINGMVPGKITRAMKGGHGGTFIYRQQPWEIFDGRPMRTVRRRHWPFVPPGPKSLPRNGQPPRTGAWQAQGSSAGHRRKNHQGVPGGQRGVEVGGPAISKQGQVRLVLRRDAQYRQYGSNRGARRYFKAPVGS